MIKIEHERELYYFINGKLYDNSYLEVPQAISKKVLTEYYSNLPFESFDEDDLLEYLKNLKISELYERCIRIIEKVLIQNKYSQGFNRTIMPIATSCYRLGGNSNGAIDFWEEKKNKFNYCISAPLYTSLAAAFSDIQDYCKAKQYADRACALSGGPAKMSQELIGVYSRIKAETK